MSESTALLRLQDIDLTLIRIHQQLNSMPQMQKLSAIKKAKKKVQIQLKSMIGARKDLEIDLSDNDLLRQELIQKIKKVKEEASMREQNFRATRDLEAHLAALAKKQEKLEHSYLEKSEELEKVQKAEKNALDLQAKLDETKQGVKASFERESSHLQAKMRTLEAERKSVVLQISQSVLSAYELASKRFQGLAVESLSGNIPSVCRVKLQPADYGDIKRSHPIGQCPYCHRILVRKDLL